MNDTEKKLYNALMVLLHSRPIVEHLKTNDPKALEQAVAAADFAANQEGESK
jgi:hypothetical protein